MVTTKLDPASPCPCGSAKPFGACHGLDATADAVNRVQANMLSHGYWLVAFVDLLGQKDAFLKTDYLPVNDRSREDAFIAEVRASTGVILGMRKILTSFRAGLSGDTGVFDDLSPEQRSMADRLRATRIREFRMSDGVILACPLKPEEGHFPIRAVYEIVSTVAVLVGVQLAAERPIRGGIDVGTGMEVDGELFGASLVKAYLLESKHAKHPRLVVGQDLVNYLTTSTRSPKDGIEGQAERNLAQNILQMLKLDFDNEWIVDHAGPRARELLPRLTEILEPAMTFARHSRDGFIGRRDEKGQELFRRYSSLVRYLEASGVTTPESTTDPPSAEASANATTPPYKPPHVLDIGEGLRIRADQQTGRILVETTEPRVLATLINPKILTHLLRGLLAADHITSLYQLKTLNSTHMRARSVAQERNLQTLASLVWGYIYEAGNALDKLNGQKLRALLTDTRAWDELEAIRKRWSSGNPLASKIRNNVSFHLGDEAFYVAGLAELAQSNDPAILFETDGEDATDLRWHLPPTVLFMGLGITPTEISTFIDCAQDDAAALGNRLNRVLVDLLEQRGVRFPPGSVAMGHGNDPDPV
jgi:SEC-C motif